jgi:CheY-like chemotaxis protein
VRTAFDGEQALEVAQAFRPEIVLLDIGMPKLNGYDACRRIRASDWGRDMIVIAQTGWGQDEDRRRTLEAGFDSHLVKPVDPMALLQLVAEAKRPPSPQPSPAGGEGASNR